ncbi:MAG: hypothetical protein Q9204_003506 [Flavoplaca sp. TL-2023a]
MDPGTALAVVSLSNKVISIISKYYNNVAGARSDIESLTNELQSSRNLMERLQTLADSTSKLPMAAALNPNIEKALSELKMLQSKLDPGAGDRVMRHFGRRALKWPFAKGEVEQWVTRFQRMKETVNLALNSDQTALIINVDANVTQLQHAQEATEQERQLAKLPTAIDAAFDSYHRQHETLCMENTRVELLQQYRDWGATHPKPLYWLSGMAGTGKSTIARTLAHHFHSIGTLGGSFFFSRSSGEANNAAQFVGTLARHLANVSPQLKRLISEAIASHEDVIRQGLPNQWKELILTPLSNYQSTGRTVLNFVIDALDECGSDDDIKFILQLCVQVKTVKEVDLGVFVTSRPEIAIRLHFDAIPDIIHQKLDLRDVPRHVVEQDLAVFVERELDRVSQEQRIFGWPNDEDIHSLVRLSDCLFIFAATACRFITTSDWDPKERLSEVLIAGSATGVNAAGLDSMYLQVLHSSLKDCESDTVIVKFCDRFRQVVGTIVVLFDELSASELAGLLGVSTKDIGRSLIRLHSVLNIPQDLGSSIRLLHPSFRDFLLNETRCTDRRFCVNGSLKHEELAKHCLKIMSDGLKRNMGHLTTPGSTPEDVDRQILRDQLPKHLQYACQYWVDHLADISNTSEYKRALSCGENVLAFFQKDFLHWLEAMSLMAKMSQAVILITRLGDLLDSASDDTTLQSIVEDARRFILHNRGIIEKAPLQTYTSALVFSPSKSFVRQPYVDQLPSWLVRSPTVEDRWGNGVQILEENDLDFRKPMITFSTDGNYIASTLSNGEIVLWEAATGAVHSTLNPYLPMTVAVKFLQNGILASMYADGTVRLFDQVTGVLFRTLKAPVEDCQLASDVPPSMNHIPSLWILPGGDLLVLLHNGQVWFWDWESNSWCERDIGGAAISRLYGCLSNETLVVQVRSVDASHWAWDLCLIDTCTSQIQIMQADIGSGMPVAISSQDIIAWQAKDWTIELVDTKDMSRTKLKWHSEWSILALKFSPDGGMLTSSHYDGALLLWDLSTQSKCMVDPTASKIRSIAFSPDSKQMATRMRRSVKLYRFPVKDMSSLQDDQSGESPEISMSPNGQQVAAPMRGSKVQIYDTQNGELILILPHRLEPVFLLAFSPDNKQLASVSDDNDIHVWDLRTGALDYTVSDAPKLENLVFSPDGSYLVSGNDQGKILVLDAESGNVIHVFEIAAGVWKVNFFSNGGRIACASITAWVRDDASVRILGVWDTVTGELLHEIGSSAINGGPDLILVQATFSADGRYSAYSLGDGSVIIYDLESRQLRDFSIAVDQTLTSLAFSRDSKYFAGRTRDGEIKQWDFETARLIGVSPLDVSPRWLSFTKAGNFLEFENGYIPIHPIEGDVSNKPSRHLTHWWYDRDAYWFMEGTSKMLWIPPAYRPERRSSHIAHHDGLFVFSNDSGIHYFKFNQGEEVTDPHEHGGNHPPTSLSLAGSFDTGYNGKPFNMANYPSIDHTSSASNVTDTLGTGCTSGDFNSAGARGIECRNYNAPTILVAI